MPSYSARETAAPPPQSSETRNSEEELLPSPLICSRLGPGRINSALCITANPPTNPCLAYSDLCPLRDPSEWSHAGAERIPATYRFGFKSRRCSLGQTLNSPTHCLCQEMSAWPPPSSISAFEQMSMQTPLRGSHLNYYLLLTPQGEWFSNSLLIRWRRK